MTKHYDNGQLSTKTTTTFPASKSPSSVNVISELNGTPVQKLEIASPD